MASDEAVGGAVEQAFGEVLREARASRGMSQEQLAFACGRHRTFISLLERGHNSPTLRTLFTIADALEMPASDLIVGVEEQLK